MVDANPALGLESLSSFSHHFHSFLGGGIVLCTFFHHLSTCNMPIVSGIFFPDSLQSVLQVVYRKFCSISLNYSQM